MYAAYLCPLKEHNAICKSAGTAVVAVYSIPYTGCLHHLPSKSSQFFSKSKFFKTFFHGLRFFYFGLSVIKT